MLYFTLITGACKNTGEAIVKKFASEGKNIIFTGREIENVKEAEERYRKMYPNVEIYGYSLDSLDAGKLNERGVDVLHQELVLKGRVVNSLILNAADLGINQKIWENPISDFINVFNTNVFWNYKIIEVFSKDMKEIGGGSVIFINSNTSYRAIPNRIAYEASKGAQLGMMRGLALDIGKYNIRVNAVLPGMIRTDRWEKNPEIYENTPSRFTPLGDVAFGSDIADACWYLSENARNTTGAELVVDGGNMIQLYPIINK